MVVQCALLIITDNTLTADGITVPLVQRLHQSLGGLIVRHQLIVNSQRHWIEDILRRWCDEDEIDLVLTVGGTFPAAGPSEAEIVPEATAAVIERFTPSLPELMRMKTLAVSTTAILDRGVAGIRGRTLIVNLPGEPTLTTLFLDAAVEPIGSILSYLHPPSVDDVILDREAKRADHKLDKAEFAEFLRKRGKSHLS